MPKQVSLPITSQSVARTSRLKQVQNRPKSYLYEVCFYPIEVNRLCNQSLETSSQNQFECFCFNRDINKILIGLFERCKCCCLTAWLMMHNFFPSWLQLHRRLLTRTQSIQKTTFEFCHVLGFLFSRKTVRQDVLTLYCLKWLWHTFCQGWWKVTILIFIMNPTTLKCHWIWSIQIKYVIIWKLEAQSQSRLPAASRSQIIWYSTWVHQ